MPRRHPRPLPPPPAHPLRALPPPRRAQALAEVSAVLGAAVEALAQGPLHAPLSPRERLRLRGRWHGELPAVARDLADLLDREAPLLRGLRLEGEDLRQGEDEARRLAALKDQLDLLSGAVADLLLVSRADLFDRAGRVLRAVAVLPEAGVLCDEEVRRLQAAAAPAAARLTRRQAAIQETKRARAALRKPPARPPGPSQSAPRPLTPPPAPRPLAPPQPASRRQAEGPEDRRLGPAR